MPVKFHILNCLIPQILCNRVTVVHETHESVLAPIFNVFIQNIANFLLHRVRLPTEKITQGVVNDSANYESGKAGRNNIYVTVE